MNLEQLWGCSVSTT